MDTRLDTSEKVPHKSAEATREFIGKKIAAKIVKPDEISRNVGEIIIPPKMRKEICNELRQVSRGGTL